MTPDRPPPPPSRPGRTEPWRIERMVQRVPAHLGETTREPVSPWIVIGGVVLLVLVSCGVLFILLDVPSRLAGLGVKSQSTPTRTPRVVTPALTILPATPPPPSPSPGPTAATVKYKVKAGDNLTVIAARYHVTIQAIMAANGLKDETILIGQELIIPLATPTPRPGAMGPQSPPGSTPTAISFQAQPSSSAPGATPGVVRHTVVRGDTLISIAATYGSSVDAIRAANQLDSDMISVGQVLQVPIGAWTPTPIPTTVALVTATPTAEFAYPAPNLLWPPDGRALRGTKDAPTLSWDSVGSLKPDEFYVVHVDYIVNGKSQSIVQQVRQGTTFYLDPSLYYPGASQSGTPFTWYVVIVSHSSKVKASSQTPQMSASSPPSSTRSFTWY